MHATLSITKAHEPGRKEVWMLTSFYLLLQAAELKQQLLSKNKIMIIKVTFVNRSLIKFNIIIYLCIYDYFCY